MTPTVLIEAIPKEDEHETVIATVSNEEEDEIVPESNESSASILGCLFAICLPEEDEYVASLVLFFASLAIASVPSLCMLYYIPNAYVSLFGLVAQLLVGSVGYGWLKEVHQSESSRSVQFTLKLFGFMLSIWLMGTSLIAIFVWTVRMEWWLATTAMIASFINWLVNCFDLGIYQAPVVLAIFFGDWVVKKCEGCGRNNKVGISQSAPQREGAQAPETV